MQIDAVSLNHAAAYKMLTGAVIPRPIAWVSTVNEAGVPNLAPFSAFTFVSTYPPMLGFNVGLRTGRPKDTAVNIKALGEYVVNIGDQSMIATIHDSAMHFPPEVSEAEMLGIEMVPATRVKVPRIAAAPVSMECRLRHTLTFGEAGETFFVGEVLVFNVRDDVIKNGKIDSAKVRPVCRLGGPTYATLGDIFSFTPVTDIAWDSAKAVRDPAAARDKLRS